ncbi:hypothetical protein [Dactylosporangium sp. NPDC051541]|uniref:hypothetical protein n=1 Tax=Dactylosporangium sp. NPDC051541 TaxID=3363977 RepID=UPI0037B4C371
MTDAAALERLRAAIRRLDGPRTAFELDRCEAVLATDAWYRSVAEYARRRLWQPEGGPGGDGGLAVGPLQRVLRWLLREEIELATRLFADGRFAETRQVCERAARIDGHCAPLALLRGMAMVREHPDRWATLIEARRWLTVAATDPALEAECRRAAEWLDEALERRERAEVTSLTENYTGIRKVYNRTTLYYVEAVNMRASLVALGGKAERARKKVRPGTPAARSLDALIRAITSDIAMLRAALGL